MTIVGGRGVKNYQILRDVIYGRPLTAHPSARMNLVQGWLTYLSVCLADQKLILPNFFLRKKGHFAHAFCKIFKVRLR